MSNVLYRVREPFKSRHRGVNYVHGLSSYSRSDLVDMLFREGFRRDYDNGPDCFSRDGKPFGIGGGLYCTVTEYVHIEEVYN